MSGSGPSVESRAPSASRVLGEARARLAYRRGRRRASRFFAALTPFLDASRAHIAIVAPNGAILGVNQAWRAFAESEGLRLANGGVGANYFEVCARAAASGNALAQHVLDRLRELAPGGPTGFSVEYPCHGRSGRRWFELVVHRIGEPAPRHLLFAHREVTQEHLARESLEASEALFRLLAESASDAHGRMSLDGKILYASPAVRAVLGYEPEELVGRPAFELLVPGEGQARLLAERARLLSQGATVGLEVMARTRSGDTRMLEVRARVMQNPATGPAEIVAVIRDITERERSQEELRRSAQQLRRLAERATSGREAERAEMANELHDELGQALTALKLELRAWSLEPPPSEEALKERVDEAVARIETTLDSVRSLASRLRPPLLDSLGLAAAIELHVRDFSRRTSLPCEFPLAVEDVEPSPQRDIAVFRILQEALTNAARHAGASRVTVTLARRGAELLLEVCDDGCGIEPGALAAASNLGIAGMRERALAAGGRLELGPLPEGGTAVRLWVPLDLTERSDGEG